MTYSVSKNSNSIIIIILGIAFFMENMDANVISTSLPAIAIDIHTNPIALKLAMTAYLVSLSIFIPISGWVADSFTAKRTFFYAICVFMLGSVLCSLSHSLSFFVFSRFLQGIGGAMMVPVGRLIMLRTTPKDKLVSVMSWCAIPALIGPLVGPPVGGFITSFFTWHWIFLINIPIGIAGLIFSHIYMPNNFEAVKTSFDFKGFLLIATSIFCFIFGSSIISLPKLMYSGLFLVLLGISTIYFYYLYASRAENPIFRLDIFQNDTFKKSIIGGSIFRVGIGAIPFLVPLMFQLGFNLSPFQSGCMTFIVAAGAMCMKFSVNSIFRKYGFYWVLIIGSIAATIMTASCGFLTPSTPYWLTMACLFIGGYLRSLFFSGINALGFSEMDSKQMSQATAIHAVTLQTSLAFGVAIAGIILECSLAIHGHPIRLSDFHLAFFIVAAISFSAIFIFSTLDKNVGNILNKTK